MRLLAISDLHLGYAENRQILQQLPWCPDDWLIVAGDVGEDVGQLRHALEVLVPRFRQIIWVPGNHELWWRSVVAHEPRGVARYEQFVALCRDYGVLTPEDDYPVTAFGGRNYRIVPMFLLYDYSFRPSHVSLENAVAWARESGAVCADEALLSPVPYPSRSDWCRARCKETFARLSAAPNVPTVLINHFPLIERLAVLPRIPRFSLWCGTRRTQNWHRLFGTEVVVYGHVHIRGTRFVDGVRFEEVSLGYPREWTGRIQAHELLRQILP
jgi:3',5'-cyclic AMP phosphodiesterase CpdA